MSQVFLGCLRINSLRLLGGDPLFRSDQVLADRYEAFDYTYFEGFSKSLEGE